MSSSAQDRIAERVKNAYAAGYEDARADRAGRMDEVADAETARILGLVREALLDMDALYIACDALTLGARDVYAREMAGRVVALAWQTAFGADDDGGER